MAAPTFNSSAIFGIGVTCEGPQISPRRSQNNAYPALNGIESLDLGDEGAVTTVSGRFYGSTLGALAAARTAVLSYRDGNAYVFTDSEGNSWPNVKLDSCDWAERGQVDPGLGYTRRYTCRLIHLSLT